MTLILHWPINGKTWVDVHHTDDNWALSVAQGELAKLISAARQDEITVPMRSEREIYDPEAPYHTDVMAEGNLYRILGITEVHHPAEKRYEMTLLLGAG